MSMDAASAANVAASERDDDDDEDDDEEAVGSAGPEVGRLILLSAVTSMLL